MKKTNLIFSATCIALFLFTSLAMQPKTGQNKDLEFGEHPDLIVRDIQLPKGFRIGSCTDVHVIIGNKSNAYVKKKFKVQLYVSQSSFQPQTYTELTVGIGPKKVKPIVFKNVPIKGKGQAKVQATVNPGNVLEESNYQNNKKMIYPKPKGVCKNGAF